MIWAAMLKVPRPVWVLAAVVAVLAFTYTLGGRNKAAEIAAQDQREYHETAKRIDQAVGVDNDADIARERLRHSFGPWPGDL